MATESSEKLVKLSALQTLAEKLNTNFATKEEVETVSDSISSLSTLVGTLPEDTTAATVVDYVAAEVASIIADAGEDYDTLKEIADWISGHADDASAMNTQITSNTEDIEALEALVGSLPEDTEATTIIDYIAEVVTSGTVDLTGYVTEDGLSSALANYYTSAEIDAMIATDDEVTAMLDEVFSDDTEE